MQDAGDGGEPGPPGRRLAAIAHVSAGAGLIVAVALVTLWLPAMEDGPRDRPASAFFGAWFGGLVPLPLIGPLLVFLAMRRRDAFARSEALSALRFHGEAMLATVLLTLVVPIGVIAGMLSFGVGLLAYLFGGIVATWIGTIARLVLCALATRRALAGRPAGYPGVVGPLWRRMRSRSSR